MFNGTKSCRLEHRNIATSGFSDEYTRDFQASRTKQKEIATGIIASKWKHFFLSTLTTKPNKRINGDR